MVLNDINEMMNVFLFLPLSSVKMDPREKDLFPSEILPVVIIGKKHTRTLYAPTSMITHVSWRMQ